jgi:DNA polymerase I-like protein with 3'-5' exonuclease and polymerase domains
MIEGQEFKQLILNPPNNVTLVVDGKSLGQMASFLDRVTDVGFDIETNVTNDFYWRGVRTLQFGNKDEQYVVDLLAFVDGNGEVLANSQGHYGKNMTQGLKLVLETCDSVLLSNQHIKLGINLSFEATHMYWNFGRRIYGLYDGMLAERCIRAGEISLKKYSEFSMETLMQRYFEVQIDKELQTSFDLHTPLTPEQIQYAALDTRLPFAIRTAQLRLAQKDGLLEVIQLENDAIGAFVDMHVHGQNLNVAKWTARTDAKKAELVEVIAAMDKYFIPIVGDKTKDIVTKEQSDELHAQWKALMIVPANEVKLKGEVRRQQDPERKALLRKALDMLETARKEEKENIKGIQSVISKRLTFLRKLLPTCEGQALINYSSTDQLLTALKQMSGLSKLKDTNDDSLADFAKIPVIKLLRDFRSINKEVDTYGMTWATTWMTGPKKEEGFLHPGDGRLHSEFNQYEAETGRTSSSKPNAQNIPKGKEIRECFEADGPNPDIQISICCESETTFDTVMNEGPRCLTCRQLCQTKAEDYVLITCDMSGAELRILAELANDKTWIEAFQRNEDLHSISTAILYAQEWPMLATDACGYYALQPNGEIKKGKCGKGCPQHEDLRNGTKSCTFLLVNGGGPNKLAVDTGKTVNECKDIMERHRRAFPNIWNYLEDAGKRAKIKKEARDFFGRRRIFPNPNWETAKKYATEAVQESAISKFIEENERKPKKDEKIELLKVQPSDGQIQKEYRGLLGSIERQGKNHEIQSGNVSIIKIAVGSGFDKDGKPFLFHVLPKYKAQFRSMIHDELVIHVPTQYAEEVAKHIQDCFKRAAAVKMKRVEMTSEYNVSKVWSK